ncbi:MAG: hypothetical protein Q4D62_09880 [Planctomycetia bacterium]|nr:hypothetical protein [Planctomycetia bacterium]
MGTGEKEKQRTKRGHFPGKTVEKREVDEKSENGKNFLGGEWKFFILHVILKKEEWFCHAIPNCPAKRSGKL